MVKKTSIRIAVREEVRDKFQRVADELGLTMSALGSYIIGQFIRSQDKAIDPLLEALKTQGIKIIEEGFKKAE